MTVSVTNQVNTAIQLKVEQVDTEMVEETIARYTQNHGIVLTSLKCSCLFIASGTLVPSGSITFTLDDGSLLNEFGDALVFTDLSLLIIKNDSAQADIVVSDLEWPVGLVQAGGLHAGVHPQLAGLDLTTYPDLTLTNADGTYDATYHIIIGGVDV